MSAPSSAQKSGLQFARTRDMDIVRSIITIPSIYRMAIDDRSPKRDDYNPPDHEAIWYVLAYDGESLDGLLGMLSFRPMNGITWDVHCGLIPEACGRIAGLHGPGASMTHEVAIGAFKWLWDHTSCCRIEARIPVFNRLAVRLARKSHMIEFGISSHSFMRNGKRWDEVLLGINKPEGV